jgi:hypothetical protein
VALFLQSHMNRILGPLLVAVGLAHVELHGTGRIVAVAGWAQRRVWRSIQAGSSSGA